MGPVKNESEEWKKQAVRKLILVENRSFIMPATSRTPPFVKYLGEPLPDHYKIIYIHKTVEGLPDGYPLQFHQWMLGLNE